MYKIGLTGDRVVIEGIKKADTETRAGAVDGIRIATSDLAEDVARHTPVKSGKARDSVIGRVKPDGSSGVVTYDYKKRGAFYMIIYQRGTYKKPGGYPIWLKYSRSRIRRQGQFDTSVPAATRDRINARREARIARQVARLSKAPRRALSFMSGGTRYFRGSVKKHPPLRGKPILTDRLAANGNKIFSTIGKSVARRLSRVADLKTAFGG